MKCCRFSARKSGGSAKLFHVERSGRAAAGKGQTRRAGVSNASSVGCYFQRQGCGRPGCTGRSGLARVNVACSRGGRWAGSRFAELGRVGWAMRCTGIPPGAAKSLDRGRPVRCAGSPVEQKGTGAVSIPPRCEGQAGGQANVPAGMGGRRRSARLEGGRWQEPVVPAAMAESKAGRWCRVCVRTGCRVGCRQMAASSGGAGEERGRRRGGERRCFEPAAAQRDQCRKLAGAGATLSQSAEAHDTQSLCAIRPPALHVEHWRRWLNVGQVARLHRVGVAVRPGRKGSASVWQEFKPKGRGCGLARGRADL